MKSATRSRKSKPKLDPWEHALICPLPRQSSFQFLEALRKRILVYLEWVTHDLAQGDPDAAAQEIQRAADRLKVIAAMLPAALAEVMEFNARRAIELVDAEHKEQETEPPLLPELTDEERKRSLYLVPFREAFGKERVEILLTCRECEAQSTYEMWEYAGRRCPECGSNKGAVKQ
jgi:hypothetical protein